MPLLACGFNHNTAPLTIREQIVFGPEKMPASLFELLDQVALREAAILSTCNRTEIYCEADAELQLIQWLTTQHSIPSSVVESCLYVHRDQEAVRHIMRVASGLDSMVLGEPQILGQLKSAVAMADNAGTLGNQLKRLFQYVFSVTKQVRSQTTIGANPVSIVFAAINLAKRIFADISSSSVMLIGAGETIELAAKHLHSKGTQQLFIANRTLTKAKYLADKFNGTAIELGEIPAYLPKADIVIAATANPLPILGKGSVERAIKVRKHRPIFIVDIAVPRDVEPEVAELPDIYLYTLDDLQAVIQESIQERQQAAQEAEVIIEWQAAHFMRYLRSLDAATTICAYRDKANKLRDDELAKAIRLLQQGKSPHLVLESMARSLTNKLLHTPSVQLRQATYEGQLEVLDLAKQLFGLKNEENSN